MCALAPKLLINSEQWWSSTADSATADVDGWVGGGHIGYNWQSQRVIYGLGTDFQWTGQDGSVSTCSAPCVVTADYALEWFGTLRGRLGYLLEPRSLLYATGGLAYGHLEPQAVTTLALF